MTGNKLQLPAAFLPALHSALATQRSAVETATLLREVGYATGAAVSAQFERWLTEHGRGAVPGSLPAEEFWPALDEFFQETGWGSLRHVALHPGVGALDSPDWAEVLPESGAFQPSCHLSVGMLAEVLGRVASGGVAVLEVECRSRGDARCRHLFGGEEALRSVFEQASAGQSYTDGIAHLG
jgi:predicted hydrocarbon binding protein